MGAILVLAAALRVFGLGWGISERTTFHPDEDKILWQLERMRLSALDLDPKDFGWGTLQTYLVGGTIAVLDRCGTFGPGWRSALRERRAPHFARLFVAGRALSALFGVLSVALAAAIAWERAGPAAGLAAAALLAVSPLHVLHSHYLTADVALAFWLALAFWTLPRSARWAGFLLGLALATKPSALALLPVLLLCAPSRERARALLAAAAGFLVGEPYALLAFRDWWSATLGTARHLGGGGPEAFPLTTLLPRHALQVLLYGLGPVAGLLALFGIRKGGRALALAAGGIALTLVVSRFPMGRYAVPLLPFLAVAAGLALARLGGARLALALALALAPPVAYSAASVAALLERHPYAQAASLIGAQVPPQTTIVRLWAEYPDVDPARYRLSLLEDPFGLLGRAYRPLAEDLVVLDNLPLHGWRAELRADVAQNYRPAVRFRRPLTLLGLPLPEPWAPHDSRYPRPEVRIYRRAARP